MARRKTVRQIVNETVEFYENSPRAIVTEKALDGKPRVKCLYLTPNGQKCAVGRCMENEHAEALQGKLLGLDEAVASLGLHHVDDLLRHEYTGKPAEFWEELQSLHDRDDCWIIEESANKLSPEGERKARWIKEYFTGDTSHD